MDVLGGGTDGWGAECALTPTPLRGRGECARAPAPCFAPLAMSERGMRPRAGLPNALVARNEADLGVSQNPRHECRGFYSIGYAHESLPGRVVATVTAGRLTGICARPVGGTRVTAAALVTTTTVATAFVAAATLATAVSF